MTLPTAPTSPSGPQVPATMTAAVHDRYGPPEVLTTARVPRPTLRPGQVLVEVAAVAVTAADTAMRAADPPVARLASGLRRPRNRIPGAEVSGVVVELAPDVADLTRGDRVVAATGIHAGGSAQYVAVSAAAAVRVPDAIDLTDAVALTEGGLTALPFLRDHGKVGPGTRLLVIGAAGSVGSAAVQLGEVLGAEVTGVCSTPHVALVRSLGARHVVDRTSTDVTATDARYDVVLDAVGATSFGACRRLLTPRGIYLTTVPAAHAVLRTPFARFLRGRRAAIAFTGLRPDRAKVADMRYLLDLALAGRIRPVVDRTLPLTEAAAAHRYVEQRHKAGSVLLLP